MILDFKNLKSMLKRLTMTCCSHHLSLPYHFQEILQRLLTI